VHREAAIRADHPPPRKVATVLGEEPTHSARGASLTGPARHLPVRDHLTPLQRLDHGTEADLQRRHGSTFARGPGATSEVMARRAFGADDAGMTSTDTFITSTAASPGSRAAGAASTLRRVFLVDVALCAATGALLLAAADPLADLADVSTTSGIRAAGAFLVALAAALAGAARTTTTTLVRVAPWSAAGDLGWALGSFVVALAVDMSAAGRILVVLQALVVVGVAAAKLTARRSARTVMIGR